MSGTDVTLDEFDAHMATIAAALGNFTIRESTLLPDGECILDGSTIYLRPRRPSETTAEWLGSVRKGIKLPPREPWPTGPLLMDPATRERVEKIMAEHEATRTPAPGRGEG